MNFRCLIILFCVFACYSCKSEATETEPTARVLAFPGAEGGGKYTTGGHGGQVIHITNLKDDINTPGCLRYALSRPGSKVLVFDVAGVIHLTRTLEITESGLTIAGQSAPGDGVCIADYPVKIKANNVIIRFMRFRLGDLKKIEEDALTCLGTYRNIIIDHCSFSWSTDECLSIYGVQNLTVQYCFITESLRKSVHVKGDHGYGGIWGGKNASFHHNLLAHHDSRNPRFDHDFVSTYAGPIDYINNVVYNWGGNSTYGGEGSSNAGGGRKVNMIANYYKPGPATKSGVKTRLLNPWASCDNCKDKYGGTIVPMQVYLDGNYMASSSDVTANNWKGVSYSGGATENQCKSETRFAFTNAYTTYQTAQEAYETVLGKAGCSLKRDTIDSRIVNEVRNGSYTYKGSNGSTNGLIDSQADVGGWPTYQAASIPEDTDMDGIPDEWEKAKGLNYMSYADGSQHTLSSTYTNLEVYLNSLVEHLY